MAKFLKTVTIAIKAVSWFSETLSEIALAGLLMLVFHEVVVRYVFNSPTIFSVELSEYLLVFVSFMSAGWVLRQDRHVRVLAFVRFLPPKVQSLLDIITSLLVMIFCLVLVWKGAQTAIMAYRGNYHSSSLLNFPLWIAYSFIPFGALVLGLQYLVRVMEHLSELLWGKNADGRC